MQRNDFANACVAMTLGVVTGMLLSVFGQKLVNQYYKKTCHERPGHNLVYSQSFFGDTYYCINSKYMN